MPARPFYRVSGNYMPAAWLVKFVNCDAVFDQSNFFLPQLTEVKFPSLIELLTKLLDGGEPFIFHAAFQAIKDF